MRRLLLGPLAVLVMILGLSLSPIPGRAAGMVIRNNVPRRVAPSMRAARSMAMGTSAKKFRSNQTIKGSQNATLTITRDCTVSVKWTIWKRRSTGIAMTIAGTI